MNQIKQELFKSMFLNENGIVERKNREWVEIAGNIICVVCIVIFGWAMLLVL